MHDTHRRLWIFLMLSCLTAGVGLAAQELPSGLEANRQQETKDPLWRLRREAYDLFEQNRLTDALPLLEKLAEKDPNSPVVQERLGLAILGYSATLRDAAEQKAQRVRARKTLLRAKELGDNSQLLLVVLDGLPEDGSFPDFSSNKEVDTAMNEGEAAFARGDLQKAIDAYLRAYLLDPKLYMAPLFIGDSYYKLKQHGAAEHWYEIATGINPDAETAWRYWGDALAAEGHDDRALAKYIEAIVAEPYGRRSWGGLLQWAERNNCKLSYTRLEPADAQAKAANERYWAAYDNVRAQWRTGSFQKSHPGEKTYRRSLAEEVAALTAVADTAAADYRSGKVKSLPKEIVATRYLLDAGVLEPAVLLTRSNEEIARDYESYRAAHRDRLRYFVASFLVPLKNGQESLAAMVDQHPSTPEDRARAVEIARRLEQGPMAKEVKGDRAWLVAWIAKVPDFVLEVCSGPLMPLLASKDGDKTGLWFQSFAGSTAFMVEHPESMRDREAVQMAGVQSALRAYKNEVARDPKAKVALLEDLLIKDKDGRLTEEVRKASEQCSQVPPPEGAAEQK